MSKLAPLSLVLAALVIASSPARAAVLVYNQTPTFPAAGFYNFFTSDFGQDGPNFRGFQTFDNFRLSQPTELTEFRWQMAAFDFINPNANPTFLDTTSWRFTVNADVNGLPGAELAAFSVPTSQVPVTFLGLIPVNTAAGPRQAPLFEFRWAPPASFFRAEANTTYWISPQAFSAFFNPIVGWTSGFGPAGGLNGTSVQWTRGNGGVVTNVQVVPNDRTFQLLGTPVPEPATLAVFAGLAGAAAVARRWRAAG